MAFGWLIAAMNPVKSIAKAMARYPYDEDSWNYWFEELDRRYGCKIVQKLQWLARIKSMGHFEANAPSLTAWRNELEINLKGLEASGNDPAVVSDEIMASLVPKFPAAILTNWSVFKQIHRLIAKFTPASVHVTDSFDIMALREFLQDQDVELRELEQHCRLADLHTEVDISEDSEDENSDVDDFVGYQDEDVEPEPGKTLEELDDENDDNCEYEAPSYTYHEPGTEPTGDSNPSYD